MADPARYYIDPVLNTESNTAGLHTERSPSGEWIKAADFEDYKAAQNRNKSEQTAIKLGLEVAALKAEVERLRSASFVTAVPAEEYEKAVKMADKMYHTAQQDGTGLWLLPAFEAWAKMRKEGGAK